MGVESPGPAAYSLAMSEDKSGDRRSGFTVTDRRTVGTSSEAESATVEASPPQVDFHTFLLSLGSSVLLHLGELDNPDGAPAAPDLSMAKHTIDIIAMLEEKTRGNLTSPEARLMESLLFDLRLRYVERSKTSSG